jgi:hypothetical protein
MGTDNTVKSRSNAGRDLLLELKRGGGGGHTRSSNGGGDVVLPPYNAKLVRTCMDDLNHSFQSLQEEVQASVGTSASAKPVMSARPSMLLHEAMIQRHKRCLLAYHKRRLDMLQQYVQNHPTLSSSTAPAFSEQNSMEHQDAVLSCCSTPEVEFVQDYHQLRRQYASAVFELGRLPPTASSMVQVRVVVSPATVRSNHEEEKNHTNEETNGWDEAGEIVLESGRTVRLLPGSVHYLPLADVEDWLYAGRMEMVDGEELGDF